MKWNKEIQNYRAVHLWITENVSAILMNRNFINLSWQVTCEKQNCGNISATKGNFHKWKRLQPNKYGKTQQEHNKIALSNCNHKYLSCNVIFSPSAKLYGACYQMEHCCNGFDPHRADVKLRGVWPSIRACCFFF